MSAFAVATSCLRSACLSALVSLLAAGGAGAVSPPPVEAEHGMVVTAQRYASEAGVEILKEGGNAVDAAVAVGYALAVVLPCCGNIGGGGFATIHLASGKDTFVNFREKAPLAATPTMYLDGAGNVVPNLSLTGYKAVAVPGTVLGLDTMLKEYGTMSRAAVMAPAIRLAEKGFVLGAYDAGTIADFRDGLAAEPEVAAIFLRSDGQAWRPGERLVQAKLAATLKAIAADGPDAFYKGAIADAVVAASAAHGGILTKRDFAEYDVTETAPVRCSYRGYDFITAPPPSSGGATLCLLFNILAGYPMAALGFHSAAGIHFMAEAMRHSYLDRNFALGDPAFVQNPLDRLLSADYAAAIRAKIVADKAGSSAEVQPGSPPHEGAETTHYSIVDKDGNAVAVTYSLNGAFGAKVIAGDTGVLLNDVMDDFAIKPGKASNLFGLVQGSRNGIAPGKRPLSSMTPTIVDKDGKLFMVVGSPGGSRIITAVLQSVINVIDLGLDPQTAVDAPRIHHQWLPDVIYAEPLALSPDTRNLLAGMGYTITDQGPWAAVEMVLVMPAATLAADGKPQIPDGMRALNMKPGWRYGANDNRRPGGAAIGY
jgi:gamma-glutamyltranspeptidase/glutathione hydrolase